MNFRPKTSYEKPDLIKSVNINKKKSEMQKDSAEIRRNFEAELMSGKMRLKSVGSTGELLLTTLLEGTYLIFCLFRCSKVQ